MSKVKKIIPELRFPEFVNEGDWDEKTLEEVASFTKGRGVSKTDIVVNGKLPCIRYGELYTHYKETIRDIKSYTNLDANDLVLSEGNDVIIPASGETQIDIATASCVLEAGIALGGDLNIIRTKINGVFLAYYLSNAKKKDIARMAQGIAVVHLYPNQLKTLSINIPKPQEQQKIASCLSSLDELITAHSDKLEALKDHKKGLMQNLFPQEGETVPNVRFREFEGDGDWVEKELGNEEVSSFVNSKIDSQKLNLKNYFSTDNMLPDYGGIKNATKLPTTGRVTKFTKGDILISNIRPYLKKVWKSDRNGGASNDVLVFRAGSEVTSDFLETILKNDAFINYVMQSAKGVKMPRGDKDSMQKYPTRVPKPQEQQKIASCLSAVDELINAQADKIEQLQQHKKGLMQGLFPKIGS